MHEGSLGGNEIVTKLDGGDRAKLHKLAKNNWTIHLKMVNCVIGK